MSGTTTRAGTPVSSLPAPATAADTDTVFMLVADSTGAFVPAMVPRSVVLAAVLSLQGGTMKGALTLSEAAPGPLDAVSRSYVDTKIAQALEAPTGVSLLASIQSAVAAGLLTTNGGVIEIPTGTS